MAHHGQQSLSETTYLEQDDKVHRPLVVYLNQLHLSLILNKNLPISISTDDPPFFSTTLSKEYEDLHNVFGWKEETFYKINQQSLKFAFCETSLKEKLIQQLQREKNGKFDNY